MSHYYDVCAYCKYADFRAGKVYCTGEKEPPEVNPYHTCEYWKVNNRLREGEWMDARETPPPAWLSVLLYIPNYEPFPRVREGFLAVKDDGTLRGYMIPALHEILPLDEVIDWRPMPVHK